MTQPPTKQIQVRVQTEDFDVSAEMKAVQGTNAQVGAMATFVGTVREINEGTSVSTMTLEHYPGMTEKALTEICEEAFGRFDLLAASVVHRVGPLAPLDQIVLVVVASAHRGEAFNGCEFIMDFLKTRAPFWKKETTPDGGGRWVSARDTDDDAANRW
ncbi:MAG: molybdopterin synthase catalytic subunit MoaE [Burkholderiaceae bacterium]